MPWLAGTALIHSLAVTEKRGLLKSWTVLLAILCFALSLLGTFLVRSGVLVSVHAFASDPARGIFILGFLAVVVGGALSLYAWRAPKLISEGAITLFSREGLLLLNNVFLVVACFGVLLGTLYPLVIDAFELGKISVGPPYFNAIFFPLMAPLFVLLGLAVFVPWKRGEPREALRRLRWPAVVALGLALAGPFVAQGGSGLVIATGVWLALFTLFTAPVELIKRWRSKKDLVEGFASVPSSTWGMTLSHIGLGLWMLGVVSVTGYGSERDVRLGPGQTAELHGFRFAFSGVQESKGPNFIADRGTVAVERGGRAVTTLYPEKRLYPSQGSVMTETGVDVGLFRDLYVALGEPIDKDNVGGDWALRLYYKPMIRFVWLGGCLMFVGGLCSVMDRRYRLARVVLPQAVQGPHEVAA
jgi:cytochrome c-type biogenesis protein CcmF